jgi:hypothetical protein
MTQSDVLRSKWYHEAISAHDEKKDKLEATYKLTTEVEPLEKHATGRRRNSPFCACENNTLFSGGEKMAGLTRN